LNRNVYDCYPVLPHHCHGQADNVVSGSTSPKMERNFAPRWVMPRLLPIPDLDSGPWDFWTDEIWGDFEH
jgi:hypothetical protein